MLYWCKILIDKNKIQFWHIKQEQRYINNTRNYKMNPWHAKLKKFIIICHLSTFQDDRNA